MHSQEKIALSLIYHGAGCDQMAGRSFQDAVDNDLRQESSFRALQHAIKHQMKSVVNLLMQDSCSSNQDSVQVSLIDETSLLHLSNLFYFSAEMYD